MPVRPVGRTSLALRRLLIVVPILAASLVAGPAAVSADHGAVTASVTGARSLVESAHVVLHGCSATNVVMRATIPRRRFNASQPVKVTAVISNDGSRSCTFGGSGGSQQYIGPCGSFPLDVYNVHGVDIWPGPVAYSCPMISATTLGPHATVTATGSWPKSAVTRRSNAPAPAGNYRLVVDRAISFSITLTAPTP